MRQVEELQIWHLVLPLRRPYVLSFGTLERLDSFVTLARFSDDSFGLGESCPLPGYSHETADLMAAEYAGLARSPNLDNFLARNRGNPFVTAPIYTCLETALQSQYRAEVRLCPVLQWDNLEEIPEVLAELAAQGNHVIKVKLTADLEHCWRLLARVQPGARRLGVQIRYDANQAFTLAQAQAVSERLDDPSTELLEQPLPVDAWEEMAILNNASPVPLMLDEAILDEETIERAAECAQLVKLKLAKNGSPERLKRLTAKARALGLDVVLGNGVQGALGCWLEAHVQHELRLDRAGEMNGFRKLTDDPLAFLLEDRGSVLRTRGPVSRRQVEQSVGPRAHRTYLIKCPQGTATLQQPAA